MKALLFVILAGAWVRVGLTAPDKVAYELQERCGKLASAEFKKEFGTPGQAQTQAGQLVLHNFQNHYSAKRNSCLYLIRTTSVAVAPAGKIADRSRDFEMLSLHDLHRNQELARFFKFKTSDVLMDCEVNGRACKSKEEWQSLVRPLLEE